MGEGGGSRKGNWGHKRGKGVGMGVGGNPGG